MDAPDAAARCSGAAEPAVLRLGSAPASSSTRTVRSSPEPAASDNAVSPGVRAEGIRSALHLASAVLGCGVQSVCNDCGNQAANVCLVSGVCGTKRAHMESR